MNAEARIRHIQPSPQHEPVLDNAAGEKLRYSRIEREWNVVTERIRREILRQPSVRDAVLQFVDIPVSEGLPNALLNRLSEISPNIAEAYQRYTDNLGAFLVLPEVPDELLRPDASHAPYYYPSEHLQLRPEEGPASETTRSGVTTAEKQLVLTRYEFARDVKRLAFIAAVAETGLPRPDENGRMELPNGIVVVAHPDKPQVLEDLADPVAWSRRRQIKDRVYEITIHGNSYILKERKTSRHRDTKKHGHQPGATSEEEYNTARHFEQLTPMVHGDIVLEWEKPLGYVSFPDGFSFTVFEFEPDLHTSQQIGAPLEVALLEHQADYEAEFNVSQGLAEVLYEKPELFGVDLKRMRRLKNVMEKDDRPAEEKKFPNMTYADYAKVKALFMNMTGSNLLGDEVYKQGYENSDIDGYAYRVWKEHPATDALALEVVGFDFEYYAPTNTDTDVTQRVDDWKSSRIWDMLNDGPGSQWQDGGWVTDGQRILFAALVMREYPDFQDRFEEYMERRRYVRPSIWLRGV